MISKGKRWNYIAEKKLFALLSGMTVKMLAICIA